MVINPRAKDVDLEILFYDKHQVDDEIGEGFLSIHSSFVCFNTTSLLPLTKKIHLQHLKVRLFKGYMTRFFSVPLWILH